MKKVLVSLPEGIFRLIKELKGKMGESDSETIRNIVIAYLSEQGYLAKKESIDMSRTSRKNLTKEIAFELDTLDTMLSSLVELLEEKGIIKQQEWESRIREKIEHKSKKSYRNLQF